MPKEPQVSEFEKGKRYGFDVYRLVLIENEIGRGEAEIQTIKRRLEEQRKERKRLISKISEYDKARP